LICKFFTFVATNVKLIRIFVPTNKYIIMTKFQIELKIISLKRKKIKNFLTIDDETNGFINGQILVYETWLQTTKS
jgi:hypothetical protein